MKRPAFQFYPADWKNNAKLRRCSEAARGAWLDILCLLHDSDEYGVCRWPIVDLVRAAGVSMKNAKELIEKGVLKGSDKNADPYIYTPRHAGKSGEAVTLVAADSGPCWYCSRFVRDEWVRLRRGQATQFSSESQPHSRQPKPTPKVGNGERQGDGPTSTSTSTISPDGDDAPPSPGFGVDPTAPKIDPYLTLEQNKVICQADFNVNGFVSTITAAGMKRENIEGWLNNFNKKLTSEGTTSKPHKDYRKHFFGWIKFQDFRTGDPSAYSPVKHGKKNPSEPQSDYLDQRKKNEEKTRRLSQ